MPRKLTTWMMHMIHVDMGNMLWGKRQESIKPLQCWRCGGPHLCRICPQGEGCVRTAYIIQGHGTKVAGKWEHESSLDDAATIRSLRAEL